MPSDTARRLHREHLARLKKMAARGKPDAGIVMHNGHPVTLQTIAPAVAVISLVALSGPVGGHFIQHWEYLYAPESLKLSVTISNWNLVTIDQIVRAVCRYYGISRINLFSQRRDASLVRPRHVAMYLAREMTAQSFPQIARAIGDRDHTTAMHGARMIAQQLERDADLARDIHTLKYRLGVK